MGYSAALAALNGDYSYQTVDSKKEAETGMDNSTGAGMVAESASANNRMTDNAIIAGGTSRIFENSEFGKLEVLMIDGKPYFPASECARMLGYSNPWDAVARHCDHLVKREGVSLTTNQHGVVSEQTTEMSYISEGDVYRLIVRSKLPSAKRFESWVMDDVLPTIRQYGGYMTPETLERAMTDVDYLYRLAVKLKEEHDGRLTAEADRDAKAAYIADVQPKIEAVEHLEALEDSIAMEQYAKMLSKHGIRIGRNALFSWMRGHGYLQKNNSPYQQFAHYFNYGHTIINFRWVHYTRVKGNGVLFFARKMLNEKGYDKSYADKVVSSLRDELAASAAAS